MGESDGCSGAMKGAPCHPQHSLARMLPWQCSTAQLTALLQSPETIYVGREIAAVFTFIAARLKLVFNFFFILFQRLNTKFKPSTGLYGLQSIGLTNSVVQS